MDTAIYSHVLGQESLIRSTEVNGIKSYKPKFFCPECGETVFYNKGHRNKIAYFFHQRSSKSSKDCELRVQTTTNASLLHKIGLPLYLKKLNGVFFLCLGFKALPQKLLQKAKQNNASLSIQTDKDTQLNFPINEENFSSKDTILKTITKFSKNDNQISINYSNHSINEKVKDHWSDYIDGIHQKGIFFHYNRNNGKRITRGSSLYVHEDYYYIAFQNISKFIRKFMDLEIMGHLQLNNKKYPVYKMNIKLSSNDVNQYKIVQDYLRDEHNLSLLENEIKFNPIWPPAASTKDGYNYYYQSKLFFKIDNANHTDFKVHSFKGDFMRPLTRKYHNKESEYLNLSLANFPMILNLQRKFTKSGIILTNQADDNDEPYNLLKIESPLPLKADGANVGVPENKNINFSSELLINAVSSLGRNLEVVPDEEGVYSIENISNKERIYILTNNYILNTFEGISNNNLKFTDEYLFILFKKHQNAQHIILPKKVRKILQSYYNQSNLTKAYLIKTLKENKIPKPIAAIILGG